MKNNIVVVLFFCATLALSSCSKERMSYPDPLTIHEWIYNEYFEDFNEENTTLDYKEGRAYNETDLRRGSMRFRSDSTYVETDVNGRGYDGTWYCLNGNHIQIVMGTDTIIKIVKLLEDDRFEWLEENGHYGVMRPADLKTDPEGTPFDLLTSNPWVYDEYFTDYDYTVPTLEWKANKDKNRTTMTDSKVWFNADGTYIEVDDDGSPYYSGWDTETYNGTWKFTDDSQQKIQIDLDFATYTYTIMQLSDGRFEWIDSDGATYAEMVH